MNTKRLGDRGEEAAASYIAARGYEILARQYRCPEGEIDLIAKRGDTIAFIEVKTRRSLRFGAPAQAVGRGKRERIARSALWYMRDMPEGDVCCRFDVIEVYARSGGPWEIRQIEGAFEAEL